MKKSALLLLMLVPVFAYAQLSKGGVFLGGTLSSYLQSSDYHTLPSPFGNTTTDNSFSISPSIGSLTSEKFALGATILYSSGLIKGEFESNGLGTISYKNESGGFGVGTFGRYYIAFSSSTYFALQGTFSLFRAHSKTTYVGSSSGYYSVIETPNYTIGLNFRPMLIFFPSPRWGVEASIGTFGYNYYRALPDDTSTTSLSISAGSFSFGVAYYFLKK